MSYACAHDVQVIAGKDKGTVAEIERVLTKKGEVIVKGVNIKLKNEKPKAENEQVRLSMQVAHTASAARWQLVSKAFIRQLVHISVMFACAACGTSCWL